jgi:parvulin-like peptidyl-prolyl isomerase
MVSTAASPAGGKAKAATSTAPAAKKAAPATAAKTLAKLNGEPISPAVFSAYVNSVLKTRPPQKETVEQKEALLRKFILDWGLSRKASQAGLMKEVEGTLFEAQIGILAEFYKQRFIYDKVTVTPREVEEAVGFVDDEFFISQITTEDEETANEVYAKAITGENFAKLATEYSRGLSAFGGGGLGLVLRSDPRYSAEQHRAIRALSAGNVTKPFIHTHGWAVVRVDKVTYGVEIKKQKIAEMEWQLRAAKEKAAEEAQYQALLAKANVWIDEKFFAEGIKDESKPYMAIVNGKTLTLEGGGVNVGVPHSFNVHSGKVNRGLLDNRIKEVLFEEAAKKEKLEQSGEFRDILEAHRIRSLAALYMGKNAGSFNDNTPSAAEIEAYYKKNYQPDIYAVRNILVRSKEEAEALRAQIVGGEDFGAIAKKRSIDSSADKRGELGYMVWSTIVPEFQQYVKGLKAGEISPVVKTEGGYGFIQVTDHKVVEVPSLERMKEKIVRSLQLQKRSERMERFVVEQQKGMKVEIDLKALAALTL